MRGFQQQAVYVLMPVLHHADGSVPNLQYMGGLDIDISLIPTK